MPIRPSKELEKTLITDNWPRRRKWMMAALIWLMANVQYLLIMGNDTALNQQAVLAMIGAIVSILCFYVFGAVWDDNNKRSVLGAVKLEEETEDDSALAPPEFR